MCMVSKNKLKMSLKKALVGLFLVMITGVGAIMPVMKTTGEVYADPVDTTDTTTETTTETTTTETSTSISDLTTDGCKSSLGEIGWYACPITKKVTEATDWLYEKIQGILAVDPIEADSPIHTIWDYCRGLTNIVFIIFLLVVIYSQITGVGISNYGIKKVLPKMIVVAILVNLSFLICQVLVDASNIIGTSLRGVFTSVEEAAITAANGDTAVSATEAAIAESDMYSAIVTGSTLTVLGGVVAFETGAIWMLIPMALGAIVAVVTGLITIALRQAVVALLVMISPLAMVAYMLPNTEKLFQKWKKLLQQMLVFYPMFSLLFGASSLAGFAIIASATDGFGVLLGTAVQIFPLFFSWKMMKMSGTFLGDINTRMRTLAAGPLAKNRAWATSHRDNTRAKMLASGRATTPSLRLMQFVSNRKVAREAETAENAELAKNRGLAYRAGRNYDKNGVPTRRGERAYLNQARALEYQQAIERDKNNMDKGLGQLAAVKTYGSDAKKARLGQLDNRIVQASDKLKIEQARGEKITYENAESFHNRMDAAINAHFDDLHAGEKTYRQHEMSEADRASARARYAAANRIMEGNLADIQFAVANAAHGYDTQKKIIETKMQKYFDMTPPSKDLEYRLTEMTKLTAKQLEDGKKAADNIDSIIPAFRILNQRGDVDTLKDQMNNLLDVNVGGGIKLGTHASQALASFLMFEVKGSDPTLRRFGKYINLETARAFNENERQVANVTYDEYIKGYHDGEPITKENPTGRMYAKKSILKLLEGTSLDDIERPALQSLDDSLKRAYGYDGTNKEWDVEGYLKRREAVQTAFEPAFLSASLKWMSGSEQINSAVKFWTGYELKQKKKDGKLVIDKNGDPVYDLTPVWEGKEFAGHEEEVKKYYQRKATDYLKDQTTGQILGMRTDYRDAMMEHLLASYFEQNPDAEREFNDRVAEIQTRYGDKGLEEAEKLRAKDLKSLKMEVVRKPVRKILGETGKLEQMYRSRKSGAANNAKDWLRGWVGLDDENEMYKEIKKYERQRRKKAEELAQKRKDGEPEPENSGVGRIYTESDKENYQAEMNKILNEHKNDELEDFFDATKAKLEEWFPGDYFVEAYKQYYEDNEEFLSNGDLYGWIQDVLDDLDEYPGNRDRK